MRASFDTAIFSTKESSSPQELSLLAVLSPVAAKIQDKVKPEDFSFQLPGRESRNQLFTLAAHENKQRQNSQWPSMRDQLLPKPEDDPCDLSFGKRLSQALTDKWALYPGATGFTFGAAAGGIAKYLALTHADSWTRNFRVGRASVIWGIAGFASNYLGGALASYYTSADKIDLCRKGEQLNLLTDEVQTQRTYIKDLSEHVRKLLDTRQNTSK